MQAQPVGGRVAVATVDFAQAERASRLYQKGGQLSPLVGQRRLLRINRRDAFHRGATHQRRRPENPFLLIVDQPFGLGQGQTFDCPRMPRQQRDLPIPGARLNLETAVLSQRSRKRRLQFLRHQSVEQGTANQQLTGLARDFQAHVRFHADRNPVDHLAVNVEACRVFLAFFFLAAALQVQVVIFITHRRGNRLSVNVETQKPLGCRQGEDLRHLFPDKTTGDAMRSCAESQRGRPLPAQHGDRLVIHTHRLRPDLGIAGQADPTIPINTPLLRKTRTVFSRLQFQHARPGAEARLGGVVKVRTSGLRHLIEHPRHPAFQWIRNCRQRKLGGLRNGQRKQKKAASQQASNPWRAHKVFLQHEKA